MEKAGSGSRPLSKTVRHSAMFNTSTRNTCLLKESDDFCYCIIETVQACGDCACSCTLLGVMIGVFVVIIIALVVYILWLHKKGE